MSKKKIAEELINKLNKESNEYKRRKNEHNRRTIQ